MSKVTPVLVEKLKDAAERMSDELRAQCQHPIGIVVFAIPIGMPESTTAFYTNVNETAVVEILESAILNFLPVPEQLDS